MLNVLICPTCGKRLRRIVLTMEAVQCTRCGELVDVAEYLPTPREIEEATRRIRSERIGVLCFAAGERKS